MMMHQSLIDDAFKSQAKDADKVADTMETLSEKWIILQHPIVL